MTHFRLYIYSRAPVAALSLSGERGTVSQFPFSGAAAAPGCRSQPQRRAGNRFTISLFGRGNALLRSSCSSAQLAYDGVFALPYPSQSAACRLEVVGLVVEKVKVLGSRVTPYNRTRVRFSSSDACSLYCF